MKKILLGLDAALALCAFTTPAHAEGDAAGGDKPADAPAKKSKKSKKSKKAEKADEGDAGRRRRRQEVTRLLPSRF